MDEWHFVDIPVVKDITPPVFNWSNQDAAGIVNSLIGTLKNVEKAHKEPSIEESMAVRFLIHIIGDLHQPLHASSLFSPQFPNGDRGGNDYQVLFKGKKQNLHFVYDAIFFYYRQLNSPFSLSDSTYLKQSSSDLMKEFPEESFDKSLLTIDIKKWSQESHDIAQDFVYNAPFGKELPSNYVTEGTQLLRKRIALGGYRLKAVFESFMSQTSEDEIIEEVQELSRFSRFYNYVRSYFTSSKE